MFELERLPAPDERGFFFHPDVPGEEESDDLRGLCEQLGYAVACVAMEHDAPDNLVNEYFFEKDDSSAAARWEPTPPVGLGWQLVAKYDTECGPYAMFVRPLLLRERPEYGSDTYKAVVHRGEEFFGWRCVHVALVGGELGFEHLDGRAVCFKHSSLQQDRRVRQCWDDFTLMVQRDAGGQATVAAEPRWHITDRLEVALRSYIGEVHMVPRPIADGVHRLMTGRGLRSWVMYYYGERDARLSALFGYDD